MSSNSFQIGPWHAFIDEHRLVNTESGASVRIEPQTMRLLALLYEHRDQVVSKETLLNTLWPATVVGDDTLARLISKLRRGLGDTEKPNRFIETIPKQGYKLISPKNLNPKPSLQRAVHSRSRIAIAAVLIVFIITATWLVSSPQKTKLTKETNETLARAHALYSQYDSQANTSAISLYLRLIEANPDEPLALAGMANALVQNVIRWPEHTESPESPSIRLALQEGLTETPTAEKTLYRAQAYAERAMRFAGKDTRVIKALALVYSAQNDLERAQTLYQKALEIEPQDWRIAINLAEIHLIREQIDQAIPLFERAFENMARAFSEEPHFIGLWHADVGLVVANLYEQTGDTEQARSWYERVLSTDPANTAAQVGLQSVSKPTTP